jgi:hypothetical protein
VIGRGGLDYLLEAYARAERLVNEAASTLEDASVSISGAGESFTLKSVRVIDNANNLHVEIVSIGNELGEVSPDD